MNAKSALFSLVFLAGCASNGTHDLALRSPEIERISPAELEALMPQPVPAMPLEEVVRLSKSGLPPEQLIEKIRQAGAVFNLPPSQVIELNQQGVDAKVLDHLHDAYLRTVREGCADEINRREATHREQLEKLKLESTRRYGVYCDPFWYPYPYGTWPYHQYPGGRLYW